MALHVTKNTCCLHRLRLAVPGTVICRGLTRSGCFSGFPGYTNHSLTVGPVLVPSERRQLSQWLSWGGPDSAKHSRDQVPAPSHGNRPLQNQPEGPHSLLPPPCNAPDNLQRKQLEYGSPFCSSMHYFKQLQTLLDSQRTSLRHVLDEQLP